MSLYHYEATAVSSPSYPFLHPKRHVDPLIDLEGVLAENRRLYRALRAGELNEKEHSWAVSIILRVLDFQSRLLDKSDLQKRVAQLEERLAGVKQTRRNGAVHGSLGDGAWQ